MRWKSSHTELDCRKYLAKGELLVCWNGESMGVKRNQSKPLEAASLLRCSNHLTRQMAPHLCLRSTTIAAMSDHVAQPSSTFTQSVRPTCGPRFYAHGILRFVFVYDQQVFHFTASVQNLNEAQSVHDFKETSDGSAPHPTKLRSPISKNIHIYYFLHAMLAGKARILKIWR
jgi:hypothetical protein